MLVTVSLCALLLAPFRTGEADPPLALVGARVVAQAGAEPLEGATVLVRDGRVEAIGSELTLPFDARSVDLAGLVLAPALWDAGHHLELSFPALADQQGRPSDEGRDVVVGMTEGDRRGLAPEREAWRALAQDAADRREHREAGFGSLLVAPQGLLLAGQGTWIVADSRPPRESIVHRHAGQFASLEWRSPSNGEEGRSYPVSLMGVLAQLRQVLLDAQHFAALQERHATDPDAPRPPADPTLMALQDILQGRERLVVWAQEEEDIRLALGLTDLFGGLRVVIAGGREAWELAGELASRGVGVIHDLDFGDEPELEPDPQDAWDPGVPARLRADRHERWLERVAGVRVLMDAGVSVAFGSFGRTPEELVDDARTAVEQGGLTLDHTLEAFTLGPHRVFGGGVAEGHVRRGAPALLAAWDGDPLSEDARVRVLVIDGVLFDLRLEEPESKETDGEDEESDKEEQEAEADEIATVRECPVELDSDRQPSFRTGGSVLVRGATVLTASHGVLEDTDVLALGGTIAAIGRGLEPPVDVVVVDARGRYLIPGIIDCHSHAALRGGINEWTRSVTAEVTVADEVNPDDVAIWRALAGGVTSLRLLHGSANVIGGRHEVVKLRWGRSAPDMVFRGAPPGIKFALGENPKRSNWGDAGRFPASRMGVEASLRRAFEAARRYRDERDRAGGRNLPFRRDLRLEPLADILDGTLAVHSHCYRSDEILMLMSVAEDFGFKVATFQHVLEGYKVAPEIAAHGALGGSTFVDWWGYKFEAYDATPYCAALMHEAGVLVSVNSDSDEHLRRLYLEAAKTVKYGGVAEQDALRMITLNPAMQLGIDDRVGSIDESKDADMALFSHHPFDTRARCDMTFVDGELVFERKAGVYDDWIANVDEWIEQGRKQAAEQVEPELTPLQRRSREVDPEALSALHLPRDATRAVSTPVRPPPGPLALVGGRVHTMARDENGAWIVHDPGVVLMRDGRIESVYPGRESPEGVAVRNVAGLDVWPGMIDAGSHIGLIEVASVKGTVDTREIGQDQPDLRTSTAYHAASEHIPVARAAGITSTLVVPQGERIAGQSAVMALEGWTAPEALVADARFLHVVAPRTPRDEGASQEEAEGESEEEQSLAERLHENWRELRQMFADAREYARVRGAALSRSVLVAGFDPRLEALAPYALGQAPVMFEAQAADQIADALQFARDEGLVIAISGGLEAWKVADLLALADVPVVVGPVLALPLHRWDPYDAAFRNAGLLRQAGVRLAFRTGSSASARDLPFHAAMAVAFGLSEDDALYGLTAGAAQILGLDDELGSLASGLRADVIVTEGSPLQVRSRLRLLVIGGRQVPIINRHTALYERYRARIQDPSIPSR